MARLIALAVLVACSLNPMVALAEDGPQGGKVPPVVVATVPKAGETNVDPGLGEIRVTFSKNMMTENMWSWVIDPRGSFPKIVGQVHYLDDKRTCVAPVKLQPGTTYWIWFNSAKHNSFKDTAKNSAVPYLLVFQTRK